MTNFDGGDEAYVDWGFHVHANDEGLHEVKDGDGAGSHDGHHDDGGPCMRRRKRNMRLCI